MYNIITNMSEDKESYFKYPKILNLYWDKSPLSFLNLLTVLSFNKYHNNWKINIYTPKNITKHKSWKTDEQKFKYLENVILMIYIKLIMLKLKQ